MTHQLHVSTFKYRTYIRLKIPETKIAAADMQNKPVFGFLITIIR